MCSEHLEDQCFTYKKTPLNDEEKRAFIDNILHDAVPTIVPHQVTGHDSFPHKYNSLPPIAAKENATGIIN